jgi:hypothetical protein
VLDLVQDDGRGVERQEASGIRGGRRADVRRFEGDVAVARAEGVLQDGRLPDCRGPVSTTTGNSRAARRSVRSSERGM